MNRYQLKNFYLKTDLVLNNQSINVGNIFKVKSVFDLPLIKINSVGIIPNGRTLDVKNGEQILAWYKDITRVLLQENATVGKNVNILKGATIGLSQGKASNNEH